MLTGSTLYTLTARFPYFMK